MRKYYLLVSDFDQTLSFNDSGLVLAEMLGIPVADNGPAVSMIRHKPKQ